jgi:hypothetical protein
MGRGARALIVLVALGICAGMASHAYGDEFDMTWTGAYGAGNAVVTATEQLDGITWDVTAITGVQNGVAISGLSSYGGPDDLIFPTSFEQIDFSGVGFTAGAFSYNLFENLFFPSALDSECSSQFNGLCVDFLDAGFAPALSSFSITPVTSAPEPSSILLLSLGLCGVLGAGIFRKRSVAGMLA